MKWVFLEKYHEYYNIKDKREELFKMVQRDDKILEDFVERILWPIHGHCTLMYPGLLYVLVVMCRVVLVYCANCVAGLPFGILHHSTSGMKL